MTKPSVGDAIRKDAFADPVIDNLNDLNARVDFAISLGGLINASFESDTDSDGLPDNWAQTELQNGSAERSTADPMHGLAAWVATRPSGSGNGGSKLLSERFPVGPGDLVTLAFFFRHSAAVKSQVDVLWYTEEDVYSDSTTIWTFTGSQPWRRVSGEAQAPGGARFARIEITGGTTDVNVAGTASFDGVQLSVAAYVPALPGTTVSTTSTSWTTLYSFYCFIPSDASTLAVTVRCTVDDHGDFRAIIGSNIGSTGSLTEDQDATSTITLNTEKGQVVLVELQLKADSGIYNPTVVLAPNFSGGFDQNIGISL